MAAEKGSFEGARVIVKILAVEGDLALELLWCSSAGDRGGARQRRLERRKLELHSLGEHSPPGRFRTCKRGRRSNREDAGEGAAALSLGPRRVPELPFQEFDRNALRLEQRRLQPDAMLKDPIAGRRYFIEYETGSATIHDAKKSTSTRAKLDRYQAFFRENYRAHFKDGWRPRLLFVTPSEARRDSLAELLEKVGFPTTGEFAARALTLDGAKHYLSRKLTNAGPSYAVARPAPRRAAPAPVPQAQVSAAPANWVEAAPFRPPAPPRPGLETGAALCEVEERLRRGRVSVGGEQLIQLEVAMEALLYALQQTQEALAKHVRHDSITGLPPDAVPILRIFSAYARRAQSELAHYGLKTADE